MSQAPTFGDLLLRVLLTAVGGALIGFDRGRGGRPAGMRTTLLVCLAACLSMLEANLLLATGGKTSSSFASMDVMRLPLGILSGMGFIGAGAILQKGNLVRGLTTAATLWFVTVMGICFGRWYNCFLGYRAGAGTRDSLGFEAARRTRETRTARSVSSNGHGCSRANGICGNFWETAGIEFAH